jgi:hypothetical protein
MDDELIRGYGRWRAAEEAGRDEDADTAFKAVFAATPVHEPPASFAARTMDAVTIASGRQALRQRRTIAGLAAAAAATALVTLYLTAGLIGSAISTLVLGGLDLLVGVVVAAASASDGGVSVWAVLANLGRASAALITDPKTTLALVAIQGIAIAALFALQRLLGTDGESFQ